MHAKKTAFTLIELLVVIAIISVLAGMLLPVFGRIQENARITKCASNLRQIGGGLFGFAVEHNNVLPQAGATFSYVLPSARNAGDALGWSEQLEPYVNTTDRGIYLCPSSPFVIPNNKPYSYFMGCRAAYVANGNSFAAIRMNLLAVPSKYILGGDISSNSLPYVADDSDKDDYNSNPAFYTSPAPFHGGKVNLLFADGHVAAYVAFDGTRMNTLYATKADGTGYNYGEVSP